MPPVRGTLTPNRPLADLTWLRVGGPADWLFQPADEQDLASFLAALDPAVPVFPMGVGSNLIVRDGGMRAVVIRLGRGFNSVEIQGDTVTAGAAALDAHVARKAAEAGADLTFLRTIPGSIGGAVRMNAGCYGSYTADHLVEARAVLRNGEIVTLRPDDLHFRYRQSDLPDGAVLVSATFEGQSADPATLIARMDEQVAKRDASQPTKERSAVYADRDIASRNRRSPSWHGTQMASSMRSSRSRASTASGAPRSRVRRGQECRGRTEMPPIGYHSTSPSPNRMKPLRHMWAPSLA
jgi:UDP-N-acetylmuramate dehydrogenase